MADSSTVMADTPLSSTVPEVPGGGLVVKSRAFGHGLAEAVTLQRPAGRIAAGLDVHTDLRSAKVSALQANRRAALHIWDPSAHLQMRIDVEAEILTGDAVTYAAGNKQAKPEAFQSLKTELTLLFVS